MAVRLYFNLVSRLKSYSSITRIFPRDLNVSRGFVRARISAARARRCRSSLDEIEKSEGWKETSLMSKVKNKINWLLRKSNTGIKEEPIRKIHNERWNLIRVLFGNTNMTGKNRHQSSEKRRSARLQALSKVGIAQNARLNLRESVLAPSRISVWWEITVCLSSLNLQPTDSIIGVQDVSLSCSVHTRNRPAPTSGPCDNT